MDIYPIITNRDIIALGPICLSIQAQQGEIPDGA
jgi:hypothetical protein